MTTWLITGTNRGIGLGLVERLATRGDRVHACTRNPDAPALAELAGRFPNTIVRHAIDVTSDASVAAAAKAIGDEPIDVLINNAGIYGPKRQSSLDMDFDGFLQTLAVNTLSPLRVAQAFLPNLKAGTSPRIVSVSSVMGSLAAGGTGALAYRASKAALNKVMQGVATDLREAGITVIVLHPGWVKTDMGGPRAEITVAQSTTGIVALIDRLTLADTGGFFTWDGKPMEW